MLEDDVRKGILLAGNESGPTGTQRAPRHKLKEFYAAKSSQERLRVARSLTIYQRKLVRTLPSYGPWSWLAFTPSCQRHHSWEVKESGTV